MIAALHEDAAGLTGGALSRARRRADAAHAQFHLDVADAIRIVHDSPHPDLDELDRVGITITGKGADRWYAALDLVASEYARDENLTLDDAHAKIHDSWRKGHDSRVLWTAVADENITLHQAWTIERQASKLAARIAVVREVLDDDGEVITLTADEGGPLFDRDTYLHVLDQFLATAIAYAVDGHTGPKLVYRCSRTIRRLTPGYESVAFQITDDKKRGVILTPCDDGLNAHVTLLMPLVDALRLQTWTNAAADATVQAEKNAGVTDPRSHGERTVDAACDLIRDGLDRHVPATSDRVEPATADSPAITGRTHKPATSVQIICRGEATTFLALDDEEAWIDGYGPVPAHVARELATSVGAMWRKVVLSPGTRDVIDVGAKAYAITDAMRRFITARDEFCQGPGCHVPAVDCDLDHVVPFPEGPTTVDNLRAYCRGHHRIKTQYVWESTRDQRARIAARNPAPPPGPDDDPPPF